MVGKSVLEILKKIGLSFRRNWGLKLISLLFAIVLWNYVITEEVNPTRPASFNDIRIVFDTASITQLNNSGFTVKGALPERTVNVTIDISRNQFKNLNKDAIRATVSLSGITSEGKKQLKVSVYTPLGTVKSQSVRELSVNIERSKDKTVPVSFQPEGFLPAGYWKGEPTFRSNVQEVSGVKVSGASSLVDRVVGAQIVVDLTGLTNKLSASREFQLLDKDGNVIDSAGLTLDPSNCIIDLDIYPTKKVKVDVSKSLNGSVAKGYSIVGQPEVSTPEIVIAGPQPVLDTIDSVTTESIDLNGLTSDHSDTYRLILPKDVIAVGESSVTVLVKVEENMTTVTFPDQQVRVLNLGSGLKVDTKLLLTTVTVTCPELLAPKLKASMIRLTVDASGLDARTHTLPVRAEYDAADTGITAVDINPESILVTITGPA